MRPELTGWIEWKKFCARKLCGVDTQIRLGGFAQSRFGLQFKRQISATNMHDSDAMRQLPSADDAWHQFESYAFGCAFTSACHHSRNYLKPLNPKRVTKRNYRFLQR